MQAPALSHLALRVGDRLQISSWDINYIPRNPITANFATAIFLFIPYEFVILSSLLYPVILMKLHVLVLFSLFLLDVRVVSKL